MRSFKLHVWGGGKIVGPGFNATLFLHAPNNDRLRLQRGALLCDEIKCTKIGDPKPNHMSLLNAESIQ